MLRVCLGLVAGLALACGCARAQEPACGLRGVRETVAPVYPPIARAAHVSGVVVVLASFDLAGNVTEAHAVSGPEMLKASAVTFVRGWQANAYGGSRSCGVVVGFALTADTYCDPTDSKLPEGVPASKWLDPLRYRVSSYARTIYDEAGHVGKRRRRFGIF